MARKAKRDQREIPADTFVCFKCHSDECVKCLDIMRLRVGFEGLICNCRRQYHTAALGDMMSQFASDTSSETFPPTYRYRDQHFTIIWQTSVPKDDEAALAYFHAVVRFSKDLKPVYCERIERDETGEHYTMLKEIFDPVNMETKPYEVNF